MMTFCALDNMLDAPQHHGLVWGGLGMMTFRALDNMLDATQHWGIYHVITGLWKGPKKLQTNLRDGGFCHACSFNIIGFKKQVVLGTLI